jgi:hypothetical protein
MHARGIISISAYSAETVHVDFTQPEWPFKTVQRFPVVFGFFPGHLAPKSTA